MYATVLRTTPYQAGARVLADQPTDKDKPIFIKKYVNRRLYNTATASFVTLDDLHDMVKSGQKFTVTDAKTSADITCSVLAQIIADEENRGHNMLPPNYLRQVLKLYNEGIGPQLSTYLEQSVDSFTANQQQMLTQMARVFGGPDAMENWAEVSRRNLEVFQQSFNMFARDAQTSTPAPAKTSGAPEPQASSPSKDDEVRALKKQLEELQKQLDTVSREKNT